MNAAELLVQALEQAGVDYVFGLPGDENLHFMEAVRQSKIKFILVRQEQAAGFMANAYGLTTGKLAVAMSTLGAGAANLVTAVAQAYLGATPVLYITGQKDIRDNHQGGYQLVDVVDMMRPITKYSRSVPSGEMLPGIAYEAIRLALEDRRGPTHIELPNDVALDDMTQGEGVHHHGVLPLNLAGAAVASESDLTTAQTMIEQAARPVILIGGIAARPDTASALQAFVEKTKIPFAPTMLGKGVVDERLPQYLGTATKAGLDYAFSAFQRADLILNVGHDVMEMAPFIMTPQSATVIHFNPSPAQGDVIYFPQHQVIGNLADTFTKLTAQITPPGWDFGWAEALAEGTRRSVANKADDDQSFPVKPQYLTKTLREFMGEHDIISVDNGIHKMWLSRNYLTYQPHTLIIDNALGSMGPALPAATALKLENSDRTVLALAGDGGFMMNVQELETAVRLNLDLICVIMNDSGLGMIRLKQMAEGYGNLGVDFGNPDFVKLADSFGATGYRLEKAADLPGILAQAKAQGGVHVIDVPVDYSENKLLMMELRQVASSK